MTPQAERKPTVITSENAQAYYDARLAEEAAARPGAEQEAAANTDEPAKEPEAAKPAAKAADPEPETDADLDAAHKEGKLSARFKELTDKRKAAEALAAQSAESLRQEREAAETARREAAELRAKYEPPKSDELGPEPQPAQFQDIAEYGKALKEWTVEKTTFEARTREQENAALQRQQQITKDWGERLTAVKTEIPDYEAKVAASPVKVSDQVRDAILESEIGPKLLYHFAEHPEDAERIGKLSVASALRELGKIEGTLVKAGLKEPAPKAAAEISRAPAPISPLKGSNSAPATGLDGNGEFHGTYAQWKEARKAGRIK